MAVVKHFEYHPPIVFLPSSGGPELGKSSIPQYPALSPYFRNPECYLTFCQLTNATSPEILYQTTDKSKRAPSTFPADILMTSLMAIQSLASQPVPYLVRWL